MLEVFNSLRNLKFNYSWNHNLIIELEKYSEEMLGISEVALAFFGKYMSETIGDLLRSAEFRTELDAVIRAVTKRVNAEETILYPTYEKCCEEKE